MVVKNSKSLTNIQPGTNVPLNSIGVETCDCAISDMGTSTIGLEGGVYRVDVNASATVAGATAGTVDLQLALDGIPVSYAVAQASSSGVADIVNLNINTYIRVPCNECGCCCNRHQLSVLNNGVATNFANITVSVEGGIACYA